VNDKPAEKLCFVVMGFGRKTDYETGRTLDLNATYEAIIKPVVEGAGFRCIRADEVMRTGVIDTEMFEMLLRAELVIADISTGNVNAVYELGVRHALRPNSTIVMKEAQGRLYFDLNKINTLQYEHLGTDIGVREAKRASQLLRELIDGAMASPHPDSPVYTFLPRLRRPQLSDEQFEQLIERKEERQAHLSATMRAAEVANKESRNVDAAKLYAEANALKPNDPYITQQWALQTYKAKQPSEISALMEAFRIISALDPDRSNDPETRGIAGAIHKRLYARMNDATLLDTAIRHYGRGYEIRRDYYNGENLATCFDLRAEIQTDANEEKYDRMSARKVRQDLIEELTAAMTLPTYAERSDRHWVNATLSNSYYGIGDDQNGRAFEAQFRQLTEIQWEIETFEATKAQLLALRAKRLEQGVDHS
jgi:hypothetical protein